MAVVGVGVVVGTVTTAVIKSIASPPVTVANPEIVGAAVGVGAAGTTASALGGWALVLVTGTLGAEISDESYHLGYLNSINSDNMNLLGINAADSIL